MGIKVRGERKERVTSSKKGRDWRGRKRGTRLD